MCVCVCVFTRTTNQPTNKQKTKFKIEGACIFPSQSCSWVIISSQHYVMWVKIHFYILSHCDFSVQLQQLFCLDQYVHWHSEMCYNYNPPPYTHQINGIGLVPGQQKMKFKPRKLDVCKVLLCVLLQ